MGTEKNRKAPFCQTGVPEGYKKLNQRLCSMLTIVEKQVQDW